MNWKKFFEERFEQSHGITKWHKIEILEHGRVGLDNLFILFTLIKNEI